MEEEKTVGLVETFDTGELSTELIPPNFTDPDDLFEILKKTVSSYHPSNDLEMINKAYELAKDAHKDQKRKSGEPYLIHPVCVAIILAQLEMDKETIVGGLLHDVVEDTKYTTEDLTEMFSAEIAALVDGVTKLTQLNYSSDKRLIENNIKATIDGRVKHLFSIYRKMAKQHKTLDQIYDLFAIRIIVDNDQECYTALGIIHEMYKPIPGRFKDYIAMPKPNHYQSLHTTLIGPTGQPFEIQIRTYEMHRTAEYGIAAHWRYKESGGSNSSKNQREEEKMAWLRRILEWQHDMDDNKEFLSSIKSDLDLYSDRIYCFTPNGDVKNLPAGSTPIDFAYAVHTAVGNKMVGARVNGSIVKLDYEIQNGDRIDIITSQNSRGPSRDWLNLVKSSQAKNKINQWFRNEFKEDNIIKGKELLHTYCKNKGIDLSVLLRNEYTAACIRKYGFRDWESVCAAIGHGGLKEGQVVNKLQDEYNKKNKRIVSDAQVHEVIENAKEAKQVAEHTSKEHLKSKSGIIVEGLDDLAVRFSKCCSPVPGDEIVGFVTRGRGVSIHRTDCVNMIHLPVSEKNRLIEAEWSPEAKDSGEVYPVEIVIYCYNRSGVLFDISRIFTENNIDVKSMNVRTTKQERATITVGFETHGVEQLDRLISKLKSVESVNDIERSTNG